MDCVILKKKENRKKWNDAYRKRLKEKSSSRTIIRSLIMEKQRQKEYYKQNRNIVRERWKKNHETNQEVLSLRCKRYYQQNASTISLKKKEDYKRKCGTKNNTTNEINLNKRGKFAIIHLLLKKKTRIQKQECICQESWINQRWKS